VPLKKEFEKIRASGKMYDSPSFGLVVYFQKESSNAKVAFVVSKKIDKRSVVRHDVKRKLSDALFPFLARLPKNLELVFLAKKNSVVLTREAVQLEIETILRRIQLL
jgi:ribonuclease P protein component